MTSALHQQFHHQHHQHKHIDSSILLILLSSDIMEPQGEKGKLVAFQPVLNTLRNILRSCFEIFLPEVVGKGSPEAGSTCARSCSRGRGEATDEAQGRLGVIGSIWMKNNYPLIVETNGGQRTVFEIILSFRIDLLPFCSFSLNL